MDTCNKTILSEIHKFNIIPKDTKEHKVILFTTNYSKNDLTEFLNDEFNFETSLRLLNLKDQLTVRSIRNATNRFKQLITKLFTKLILNYILFVYGNEDEFKPWKDLDLSYNEFGKPFLIHQKQYKFQFNSSSSNDIISTVIELNSSNPIGIDLSHSKQAISSTNFLEEFKPIFDPKEISQLLSITDTFNRYVIFNQFWTLKEAFTKLLGSGLNIDLSSFYFTLNNSSIVEAGVPEIKQSSLITEFLINWKKSIDINIDNLVITENLFLDKLNNLHFNCSSGLLEGSANGDLPVIISIINQGSNSDFTTKNFNLDFFEILKRI